MADMPDKHWQKWERGGRRFCGREVQTNDIGMGYTIRNRDAARCTRLMGSLMSAHQLLLLMTS